MQMARILVIDDDEIILKVIADALTLGGYQVQIADSGKAGIQHCLDQLYDLIIVDVFMPVMDGLEVIRSLRKKFSSLKIIAMTGHSNWEGGDVQHIVTRMGADGFISKPFNIKELYGFVESLVGKPK